MPNRRLISVYPEACPGAGYQLYVYENRTTTQAALVNGDGESIAQPVFSDADGLFEAHPYADGALYTVAILDPDSVMLSGYPRDDVPAIGGDLGTAAGLPFTATDDIPANNVQDAIELVGDLASAQEDLVQRSLTPWPTGGTGDAYTVTPDPALTAYVSATALMIRPNRANTGAATLNANGLGARDLRKIDRTGAAVALVANDLLAYQHYLVVDDGTRWVVTLGAQPMTVTGANGTATYHADGRLEMYRTETIDLTANGYETYAFPATPTAIPFSGGGCVARTAGTIPGGDLGVITGGLGPILTATGWSLYCSGAGSTAAFATYRLWAVGRWY